MSICHSTHCVKSVRIWCYSCPHFPTFGLNTERYGASLRIQSECGKIDQKKLRIWTLFTQCRILFGFHELNVFIFTAGKSNTKQSFCSYQLRKFKFPYVKKEKLIQSLRNFHSIIFGLIKNYFCDKRPSIEQEITK